MAALDFPTSPSVNDEYVANGKTYVWNGTSWINKTSGIDAATAQKKAIALTLVFGR